MACVYARMCVCVRLRERAGLRACIVRARARVCISCVPARMRECVRGFVSVRACVRACVHGRVRACV